MTIPTAFMHRLRAKAPLGLCCALLSLCSACEVDASAELFYSLAGKGDLGMNDEIYLGALEAAADELGSYREFIADQPEKIMEVFYDQMSFHGYDGDFAVLVSSDYLPALEWTGCDVKGRGLLLLDMAPPPACADTPSLTVQFKVFGPSFLAGVAAASATDGETVTLVDLADQAAEEAAAGFQAGVLHAGGTNRVVYLAPEASRAEVVEASNKAYERGAGVLFAVMSAHARWVVRAAQEDAGRLVVGYGSHLENVGYGVVLGSVVKDGTFVLVEAFTAVSERQPLEGHQILGMADPIPEAEEDDETAVRFTDNGLEDYDFEEAVDAARDLAQDLEDAYWDSAEGAAR